MADTQVLGTCVFGRAGSSPASRTQISQNAIDCFKENPKGPLHGRKSQIYLA